MNENPFGITKEEVLNLAAQKLADACADNEELESIAKEEIRLRVTEHLNSSLNRKMDEFLTAEMTALIQKEIIPVDVFGDKCGNPTTIRAALMERARIFWEVKVDREGKMEHYGGTPRHEHLMRKILDEEFAKAVKDNATVIVAEFKKAITADCTRIVKEHIDKLIK